MVETIFLVLKKNKGILIGIISFLAMIGFLMGLFKKVPIKVVQINPKEIYRETILSEIASLQQSEIQTAEKLFEALEEKTPHKDQEIKENQETHNPFSKNLKEENEKIIKNQEQILEKEKSEIKNKLPEGVDSAKIHQIDKTSLP